MAADATGGITRRALAKSALAACTLPLAGVLGACGAQPDDGMLRERATSGTRAADQGSAGDTQVGNRAKALLQTRPNVRLKVKPFANLASPNWDFGWIPACA